MRLDRRADPDAIPLAGSLLDLKRDPLGALERARREHGDVVRFALGPRRLKAEVYGVFAADAVQQVLAAGSANFRKDNPLYNEVRESIGNGLLTSLDDDYVRQRRLVQPLFTKRHINAYAEAFAGSAATLAGEWRGKLGGTIDLAKEMNGFTLRTAAEVLFGADMTGFAEVVKGSFQQLGAYSVRRGYALVRTPRSWRTPANRRAAAAQRELYGFVDALIAKRVAAPDEGDDLLSRLVTAQTAQDGRANATEVRDQVLIFLLASQDTTATAMTYALYLMATDRQVQARAREEARRVLGERLPTAADLESLPYLTMVFKEAMRLYPPGPIIARRAVEPARLSGRLVPAGAEVFVAAWVTHRHPAYWKDPERCDPLRFAPENESAVPRYAYFPFGGGGRACIGQHFAMLNALLPLAMMVREFELSAVDIDPVLDAHGITLATGAPLRARITEAAAR